jgi:predicted negative regulator of RcsB-dependent stress response
MGFQAWIQENWRVVAVVSAVGAGVSVGYLVYKSSQRPSDKTDSDQINMTGDYEQVSERNQVTVEEQKLTSSVEKENSSTDDDKSAEQMTDEVISPTNHSSTDPICLDAR